MLKALWQSIANLFILVFTFIFRLGKSIVVKVLCWLMGILKALRELWLSLGPKWFRIGLIVTGVVAVGFVGVKWFVQPNLTIETVHTVHYLNEGWSDSDRQQYYYTPQGTELLGLRYDWFVNLEMPLSEERLASPDNMRGWGFIVTPGQKASPMNPGNLPVGLARHIDPQTKEIRLDLTCAMCHTGELHYNGVALRVDGGQAVQSVPTVKRGEFIPTIGATVLETYVNPSKWGRFADRVVGKDEAKREQLRKDLWAFLGRMKAFAGGPGATKLYPTEEGRGRTDAVGRIANVVFGYDLDEPSNYKVADAPVSYPFVWDIWRFDWVQYTGFTNQAMARNSGEALGVLAPIKLVDDQGKLLGPKEFGQTLIEVDGIHCIESVLRELKPPKWPEAILGKIDIASATRGKDLFMDQCVFCHGPHVSKPYQWEVATGPNQNPDHQVDVNWQWDMAGEISYENGKAYRKDWRETVWALPMIETKVVGTDPTAANNFIDNKYDGSKIIPGSQPVNASDGLQILLNRLVPKLYEDWGIKNGAVPSYDGLNVPFRIRNVRGYKSRPLHGVWATPPFLHNGSVPSIYHLLSPLRERPRKFGVGNRQYDPVKLGYVTDILPGSFVHDVTQKGNGNQGHLFTDVDMPGRIGELLTERQRMDIIEYLKIMGNPDFSTAIGGDPLNWNQYSKPPVSKSGSTACQSPHLLPNYHVKQEG